jgi:hypothetical protein
MNNNFSYKVGGSLTEDAPSYVVRKADFDLYNELKAGNFCYIFNSRQMGKTSLQVRTIKRLQSEGDANNWAADKSLSKQDYQFLNASHDNQVKQLEALNHRNNM